MSHQVHIQYKGDHQSSIKDSKQGYQDSPSKDIVVCCSGALNVTNTQILNQDMSEASSLFLAIRLGRFRRKAQTFTGWPNLKVL
jgi:hypothetical protein